MEELGHLTADLSVLLSRCKFVLGLSTNKAQKSFLFVNSLKIKTTCGLNQI